MQAEERELTREERRAEIRAAKRRKLRALAILVCVLIAAIILVVFVVKAINTQRDASFKQIGPFPPEENMEVVRIKKAYNWAMPVPEADPVADSHFVTALIVGDTRVEGISLYLESCPAELYYSQSMTAQTALSAEGTPVFASDLAGKSSVYIMLGLNEMGWAYPELYEDYLEELLSAVGAAAPKASVYVSRVIPLTAEAASSRSYMDASLVASMNSIVDRCAKSAQCYIIDPAEVLCGEDGWLLDAYAEANGLSLNQSGYEALYQYLKTHVVDKELYL